MFKPTLFINYQSLPPDVAKQTPISALGLVSPPAYADRLPPHFGADTKPLGRSKPNGNGNGCNGCKEC